MIKKVSIEIWERQFDLNVVYDCYSGESVTQEQFDALDKFISSPKWIANAKKDVEKHCKKQVMHDDANQKKDNIFSYIKPEAVFIKRDKTRFHYLQQLQVCDRKSDQLRHQRSKLRLSYTSCMLLSFKRSHISSSSIKDNFLQQNRLFPSD